jgi:pimeloyl-ACP methyl ester carboxylesterase
VSEDLRGGARGVAADYAALSADWGFPLEDIAAQVHIWQGVDDRMIPPVHARNLATRLAASELNVCPGEGHFIALSQGTTMLRQAAGLE